MTLTREEMKARGFTTAGHAPGKAEWEVLELLARDPEPDGWGQVYPAPENDHLVDTLHRRGYLRYVMGVDEVQITQAGLFALKAFHALGGYDRLEEWNVDRWEDFESIPVGAHFHSRMKGMHAGWIRTKDGCDSFRLGIPIVPYGMNELAPFFRVGQ